MRLLRLLLLLLLLMLLGRSAILSDARVEVRPELFRLTVIARVVVGCFDFARVAKLTVGVGLLRLSLVVDGPAINGGPQVPLARLVATASLDVRRKIVTGVFRPLAYSDYGHRRKIAVSVRTRFDHRRKIVVSVRGDSDHRRKIVVSGRRGVLLVVVVLVVVLPVGVVVVVVVVDNEVLSLIAR